MKNLRLYFLIGSCLIVSFATAQHNVKQKPSDKKDKNIEAADYFNIDSLRIDSVFKQFDKTDCPGCAVAVINAGNIIFQKEYGMANLEHRVPISPKTVFDVASVTKQFTAWSILLLESRGKLSLDDNVRKYVPELPDFGSPVTIRHLVHHTSGLRDFGELLMMTGWRRDSPLNSIDFIDIISRQKQLNYLPGEKLLYNNTNYALMGLIVERIDGRSYADFINDEVLRPLGMTTTTVRYDPWMVIPNIASKYTRQKDSGYKVNFIWSFTKVLGPMGILTSVEDLAKWDGNFYNEIIGGKGITNRMYTEGLLNSGKSSGHAFGIFASPYKGMRRFLAEGSGGGSSVLMQFPDDRLTIVLLCNVYDIRPSMWAEKVADIVLGKKSHKDKTIGSSQATSRKVLSEKKVNTKELEKYEGVYWINRSTDKVKFAVKNGLLTEQYNQEKQSPLVRLSDGSFYSRVEDLFYRFDTTKAVVSIETAGTNGTIEWERAERKIGSVSIEQLPKYTGKYYSKELDLAWSIYQKDGRLYISRKKFADQPLESLYKDGFYFVHANDLTSIRFRLDFIPEENESFKELRVSWGRLADVVFTRVIDQEKK